MRQRARIVLLAADGMATRVIAREVGCTIGTASKWRVRYAARRLAGLAETGNRGAAPRYTSETGRRILATLDGPLPAGHGRWTAPLIAAALGDVHEQSVWRFLRAQKIDLAGRKSWCVSHDPEFAAKAAEIVGLYPDPPEGALVVASTRSRTSRRWNRAERAVSGRAYEYTRHGTSTLFAAFNIANGEVTARHYKRRRRIEFLDFINRVVTAHRGREIHVILDKLKTHKPKRDGWLAQHENVHFHFTPTHASWLNQVEGWFSILGGQSLQRASFTSVAQLRTHIDAFIEHYNQTARPFAWNKSEVYQKRLKPRFADL
jgi:transposase